MMELPVDIADFAFREAAGVREWFDTDLGPETYVEVEGMGYTVWIDSRNRFAQVYEYWEENTTPARMAKASPTQHQAVALAATTALGDWVRKTGA